MGNISTDQKLQLVQQIRAENQENRMKMRSRERIIYGTQAKNHAYEEGMPLYYRGSWEGNYAHTDKELYAMEEKGSDGEAVTCSSFKLRLVLAVFLFASFLILDSGIGNVAGISTTALCEELNKDFDTGLDEVVFDFENNFPYTLFKK